MNYFGPKTHYLEIVLGRGDCSLINESDLLMMSLPPVYFCLVTLCVPKMLCNNLCVCVCVCVFSNANPLHYYALRVPSKADRWR